MSKDDPDHFDGCSNSNRLFYSFWSICLNQRLLTRHESTSWQVRFCNSGLNIFFHRTCYPLNQPKIIKQIYTLHPDLAIVHSTSPGAPTEAAASGTPEEQPKHPRRLKQLKSSEFSRSTSTADVGKADKDDKPDKPKPKRTAAKAKAGKSEDASKEKQKGKQEKPNEKKDQQEETPEEQVVPKKNARKERKEDKEKEKESEQNVKPSGAASAKAKAKTKAKAKGKPREEDQEPPGEIVDPKTVASQALNRADTQELQEKEKARLAYKARKERFYRSMVSFGLRSCG